jgi:hypothetical protein
MRYEPTDQAILRVAGARRPDRRIQDASPSLLGIGSGLTRRIALEVYSASKLRRLIAPETTSSTGHPTAETKSVTRHQRPNTAPNMIKVGITAELLSVPQTYVCLPAIPGGIVGAVIGPGVHG